MVRLVRSIVMLVALGALVKASPVGAQELAVADASQRPRFLLASDSRLVPLDVDRTPSLARRLELSLEGVPLKQALTEIASLAGLRLAFSDNDLPPKRRVRLRAEAITVAASLTDVLLGTGLDVVFGSDGGASLVKRSAAAVAQPGRVVGRVSDQAKNQGIAGAEVLLEGTKWHTLTGEDGRYMLAEVAPGSYTITARRIGYRKRSGAVTVGDGQEVAADFALQPAAAQLGEVVVTAEKREARLQDVPTPVTAIPATQLAERNQPRLRDYFASVPGLSVSPTGAAGGGQQVLAIRGISSGNFGNPTVGVTIDDVPYGPFTREFAPDVDPSDLERVEVLRGPHGTLYGASSMGGLLKFVTVDPSTERVSGRVQADVHGVHNGAQAGYGARGSVNLPLSETWAARVSGFTRQDPGYIDNPVLAIDGVNKSRVSGGRLSTLWRPSDAWSVKLSALYQQATGDGVNDVDIQPGLGDLEQSYIRGSGAYEQQVQAYSAILTGQLGSVELASVTGYNVNKASNSSDFTFAFGGAAQQLFDVPGASVFSDAKAEKFSQEIRASIPMGQRLGWLVGGFFTHENIPFTQNVMAQDPPTGAVAGRLLRLIIPITHTEYAGFANLTVNVTDRFDVQLGARQSHLEENFETVTQGGALLGTTLVFPAIDADADVFTYLATPRFRVSRDLMLYARMASGYRPGRSNSFNPDPLVPRASDPDRTRTFEIGVKGNTLNHVLSYDASLFYIDWKDIQINLVSPSNNISYFTNGSRAKSQGVELSVEARPLTGLNIAAWGTLTDAVLTESFPAGSPAFGPEGSRLPFGTRVSGNLAVDQEFPVTRSASGFAGATVSYVGERVGIFVPTPERAIYPSYTRVDLRAGLSFASWSFDLYANNIADERGVIGGGAGTFPPSAINYIQPRTVGLSVVRTF